MARRGRKPKVTIWQSSRSTIVSGLIAIVVIIGLFVAFNALPATQPTKQNDNTKTEQSKDKTAEKSNDTSKKTVTKLPAKHTVAAGENLWDISKKYYGDGFKWVLIATENKVENPNIINPNQVLTIPKADTKVREYTVAAGDCLWSIAQKFYGNGFDWTKIRDMNPGKIGTLSNGEPLISPGETLVIP